MSDKVEAVLYFKTPPQDLWEDEAPNHHRKSHFNYSQNVFSLLAFLMQRFQVSQTGSAQVLKQFFNDINVDTPIPSQASISRELKRYLVDLKGMKYLILDVNKSNKTNNLSVSYRKPTGKFTLITTITATQTDRHTVFKFQNYNIKLKRTTKTTPVLTGKTPILKSRSEDSITEHSASINKWIDQNNPLIKLIRQLTLSDDNKLFNALIPLLPKQKDKTKKLSLEDHYTKIRRLSEQTKFIRRLALITTNQNIENNQTTDHLQAQTILFEYKSSKVEPLIYRIAIWVHCPYSKLSFIRLHSNEFLDSDNKTLPGAHDYGLINVSSAISSLALMKKNNEIEFTVHIESESTNLSWSSKLKISMATSTQKKTVPTSKNIHKKTDWNYDFTKICVGEKIKKNEALLISDKKTLSGSILKFSVGEKDTFSKTSFERQLKTWLIHINDSNKASLIDEKTYQKNKHTLIISD